LTEVKTMPGPFGPGVVFIRILHVYQKPLLNRSVGTPEESYVYRKAGQKNDSGGVAPG
jgi:hypothetical protein